MPSAAELRKKFAAAMPGALVNVFGAPAVPRLGRAGGFRIMIEDRGDVGPDVLQGQTDNFVEAANQQKQLVGLFTVFKTNSPQLFLDVDRGACCDSRARSRRGVRDAPGIDGEPLRQRLQPLRPHLAGERAGRSNRIATKIEDVKRLKVRNRTATWCRSARC